MSTHGQPIILFVDDNPEEIDTSALGSAAVARVRAPSDVDLQDLKDCSLVLVDYRLEDWPDRDKAGCIALKPLNGLAVAAILRSHAGQATDSPTAFAIHSAHLPDLAGGLPPQSREHAIASANNLEWVFAKPRAADRGRWTTQVLSIASAVGQLPTAWPGELAKAEEELARLLAAPSQGAWVDRALTDVRACHPPLHELSLWTHGLAIIRWLLHRILPYPCFLSNVEHMAARFRVTTQSLVEALQAETALGAALQALEYKGILAGFLGPRWWRVAIENFLWELTGGRSADVTAVRDAVSALAPNQLIGAHTDFPIVCVDRDYRITSEFSDIEHAVRIQPDEWPPYADEAWTTIELARAEPTLAAFVIEADRERLERAS
jgi:hypothetical protein